MRTTRTFIEAITRVIRSSGSEGRSDNLLRSLFFTGYINRLSSKSHDVREWLKPILDTGFYGGSYRNLHTFRAAREVLQGSSDVPNESLMYAGLFFVQNEIGLILSRISSSVRPNTDLLAKALQAQTSNDGLPGGMAGERPTIANPDRLLVRGYDCKTLRDAAYLILYEQLTQGEYRMCPECGQLFLPQEGREDDLRGRRKIFCETNCEHRYNTRKRRAQKRDAE